MWSLRKATFRQKENPVVLFLYQQCEEAAPTVPVSSTDTSSSLSHPAQDTVCGQAMTALANLVSPISHSASGRAIPVVAVSNAFGA